MTALLIVSTLLLGQTDPHAGHAGPAPASADPGRAAASADAGQARSGPAGYAPVPLKGSAVGPFAVKTARVERRALQRTVRTVGIVTWDETRTSHVHARVKGYVEALSADFIGKKVKAGESLAELYSPAAFSAGLEFVTLLKLGRGSADPLVDGARRRLTLWDVPPYQVRRMEQTLTVPRTFSLLAPRGGTLVSRLAFTGLYVEPGTELFVVSDLSWVWVLLDVYEADVPFVTLGQPVQLSIEGVSGLVEGKVGFLPPTIDEASRTLKVRVALENPTAQLRPGAFATAELALALGEGLAVPEDAVIRTGKRNLVFLRGPDTLQPREVTLGPLAGGFYRVEAGLAEGDEVVTGAQFLLDSDSRLRATSSGGGGHAGHGSH